SILTGEYSVVDDQSQDQVPDGVNTETGEITEPAPGQQSDTVDTGTDELNLE
ncbi:recombinase RecT, partial [Pseudomonas aeruginosa]